MVNTTLIVSSLILFFVTMAVLVWVIRFQQKIITNLLLVKAHIDIKEHKPDKAHVLSMTERQVRKMEAEREV